MRYLLALSIILSPHVALGTTNAPSNVKRYDRIGVASYYTVKSCIKEGNTGITASGKRLDDNGLTCATPFRTNMGKRLLVTNTANGRSVVCRVNDIGPNKRLYAKGRVIDLSAGAFKAIANLKQGLINVEVKEL